MDMRLHLGLPASFSVLCGAWFNFDDEDDDENDDEDDFKGIFS